MFMSAANAGASASSTAAGGPGWAKNSHSFLVMKRAAICFLAGLFSKDLVDDLRAVPVLGRAEERLHPGVVAVS